ncbi:MAG: hypothetical protein ACPLPR_09190, partial [Bacillota bacterium]
MQDAVAVTPSLTLRNIEFLKSQIKKPDAVIAREFLKAFPQILTTIPSIGSTSPTSGTMLYSLSVLASPVKSQICCKNKLGPKV